jgi:hypothetical protein
VSQLLVFLTGLFVWLLLGTLFWLRSRKVPEKLVSRYRWTGRLMFMVAALDAAIVLIIVSGVRSPHS